MVQVNADVESERLPQPAVPVRVAEQGLTVFGVVGRLVRQEEPLPFYVDVVIELYVIEFARGIVQAVFAELFKRPVKVFVDGALLVVSDNEDDVRVYPL